MLTKMIHKNNNLTKLSKQEQKIINIIRLKSNQKLTIIVRDNVPIRLKVEEEIPVDDKSLMVKLSAIRKEKEFQNINVYQKYGKPYLIKRTETVLLNNLVKAI